jgi:hypothetical protein
MGAFILRKWFPQLQTLDESKIFREDQQAGNSI